jgi:hypothetical protein
MNTYNKEKESQERVPGADSPEELMKKAKNIKINISSNRMPERVR